MEGRPSLSSAEKINGAIPGHAALWCEKQLYISTSSHRVGSLHQRRSAPSCVFHSPDRHGWDMGATVLKRLVLLPPLLSKAKKFISRTLTGISPN
ncbi:hypothetical protein E2C01_089519 [Portunus trituberculatus]|uniref:Uncharacterized protein n=1 Tax=Portunus trituberculatus TaxID=210409 RepID=A0A5B7JJ05_PORTR|nr:hypothetical protein [Portunus trituberculatus]